MPPRNDDTNVFRIPHGRMLQLVNTCNKTLTVTDFANNDALFSLLTKLQDVFKEFKSHEEIENEFIMKKLKLKLKALAIHNSAVCNCHKEDAFTPLFQLVDMGYLHVDKTKTTSERLHFGVKFRKALNEFTKKFLPHMKEEEEEFQPLLSQYFSENELVEMKNIVIKSHIQQRKSSIPTNIPKNESNKTEILNKPDDKFSQLPNEVILKIFSHLNIRDRLKVAQVSKSWKELISDKFYWKKLSFQDWKQEFGSQFTSNQSILNDFDVNEDDLFEYNDETYKNNTEEQKIEMMILTYWAKTLLPKFGKHINELDVSSCKTLNNNVTRRILQLCLNLKKIDLSYTKISANSFRGVHLDKLEYFNCEGCINMNDEAFKHLLLSCKQKINNYCFKSVINSPTGFDYLSNLINIYLKKDKILNFFENSKLNSYCNHLSNNIEDMNKSLLDCYNKDNKSYSLKYINLSGCWLITDFGLGCIAAKYKCDLEYLNLSGCINITPVGMNFLVNMSSSLTGENLYYCDNITDGPMKETANSCDSYCSQKFCCRRNH